ncbi:SIMPL domain-containing protein [Bradyrhizobium sp. ORS 375]|uniref:SIMPL domain-containing protein n=1 Tax=Bradyrhizobium sp. (strain ORS 375) TaxID=566679 RepID=UPI00030AC183|nr:SIMPL domain-containing protein [Bradyrhizobium sp. ORS 375]
MIRPLLVAALAAIVAMPALADDIARQDTPAITVSGEGSVQAPPDLAQIDAGVASDAKTAREAAEANNSAMAKVLQALKTAGIADKDVQTSRLSLQPQYAQNRPGQPAVTGYRASNRVTIKLHDVAKVASVIDTVVAAGANDVGNVFFSVAEPSKLLDQARERAVTDARRKAEIYAKAAGVTLGQPLNIAEDGTPTPVFRAKTFAAPMAAGAPTPVAQGEETLSVTVSVTWAIKAGQ